MAGANSTIQVSNLDFNSIKSNFITYLQGQDTFKDYNFEGSSMSILLDLMAYNTQYNAYYLNMVANEMFLDSAIQRSSVVSQAKLLNYTPKSSICPSAIVDVNFTGVTTSSLTLPRYTNFLSAAIDGVNYNFVTTDTATALTDNGVVSFENVELKQGIPASYSYTVSTTQASDSNFMYEIPDTTVDTTTLTVTVKQSASNTSFDVYQLATNGLTLTDTSKVYFLQESLTGTYEIYFGDGLLGKKLIPGNIINISYLTTEGTQAAGANSFQMMSSVSGFFPSEIVPILAATTGGGKESIDSIKFQAPKSFSAQGRAVTKNDYISAIQENTLGIPFDGVNVWGGEENDPPVYGQVFVSLKPSGGYNLTATQKTRIISEIIKPISVMTVVPTLVDPDYTYIKLNVNVYYDPSKTNLTAEQIKTGVIASVNTFATTELNTFNSTFNTYNLLSAIQNYSQSIITSEFSVSLQKKFFPNLANPNNYNLVYGTPLQKGSFLSGVNSSPDISFPSGNIILSGMYIEEVPSFTVGIESISVTNPGFNYQETPTVTILGDGTGATAHAVVSGGTIKNIVVDTPGSGYTTALVTITTATNDSTGQGGSAYATIEGGLGILRTYYNNASSVKTTFNSNVGTIDYARGVINLNNFAPIGINNPLGQLTISAKPSTSIISSTYNRIITIDAFDPNAISVTVIPKTNS